MECISLVNKDCCDSPYAVRRRRTGKVRMGEGDVLTNSSTERLSTRLSSEEDEGDEIEEEGEGGATTDLLTSSSCRMDSAKRESATGPRFSAVNRDPPEECFGQVWCEYERAALVQWKEPQRSAHLRKHQQEEPPVVYLPLVSLYRSGFDQTLQQVPIMEKFVSSFNYSHRNVTSLPEEVIIANSSVTLLDVSNNQISDITFTERFTNLNSLILDHNLVTADVVFPYMPTLTTLWLNYNKVDKLTPFITHLSNSFPNLRHLSMMGNKASPPCTEDTFYSYVKNRLMILSFMTNLEYLDDRAVTQDEREEAQRLYGMGQEPPTSEESSLSGYLLSLVDKVFDFVNSPTVTGSSTSYNDRASVI